MKYFYKGTLAYSSHNQIAKMLLENGSKRILEVGCNEGFIGKALRKNKWKGFLLGIDKDKYFRKVANNGLYDQFMTLDIEKDFNQIKNKYDVIIFADVLEHLDNPLKVLKNSKKKLKKDGSIIISLPNVANFFIRLKLLLGNFTYADYGILDKEHKYFFTYKTAKELIENAGLFIIKEGYTPIPTPLVNNLFASGKPLFFIYYLARFLSLLRKELFGYQFIFVCQKN